MTGKTKTMMYPKSNNLAYDPFEVHSLKEEKDGLFKKSYIGTKVDGESFHCSKDYWFKLETEISLPWHTAPPHTTHFDANELTVDRFYLRGWMRIANNLVYRWGMINGQRTWIKENRKPENLIPRPIDFSGVSTPEEDEEFERIKKSSLSEMVKDYEDVTYESQRPQEWFLAQSGRNIERFGKLLQDPKSTISDLAGAAHDAGIKLRLSIQPMIEDSTNEQ